MLILFYLQDYRYSPITQLFLKYFNDLCHKTYFNRNFGAVALARNRKTEILWIFFGIHTANAVLMIDKVRNRAVKSA